MMFDDDPPDSVGGVNAVEQGASILKALAMLGPAPMLKDIALRAGMSPPKAHRYLVSFIRTGMVSRNGGTGRYELGPLAIQIGLAALRRLDVVSVATPALPLLSQRTGQPVFLAVWGTNGPTIVRSEDTDDPYVINSRPGSVLPMLPSATGRVFGAYLPRAKTRRYIEQDLGSNGPGIRSNAPRSEAELEALFARVREEGMATTLGDLNIGIHAVSVPILDHTGALAGALTVLGVVGMFDSSPDGPITQAVKEAARGISERLGLMGPEWVDPAAG